MRYPKAEYDHMLWRGKTLRKAKPVSYAVFARNIKLLPALHANWEKYRDKKSYVAMDKAEDKVYAYMVQHGMSNRELANWGLRFDYSDPDKQEEMVHTALAKVRQIHRSRNHYRYKLPTQSQINKGVR